MVMRTLLTALLILLFTTSAGAQEVVINPGHPDHHVVVKGDTLWHIAGKFLRDPWRWPQVWEHNPEIKNPHLIYPGDTIYLTYRDGKPVFSMQRANNQGDQVVKLSPQIHTQANYSKSIHVIPMDLIKPFLSKSYVVSDQELGYSGYILANDGERLIAGEGNIIYARNLSLADSNEYMIYRSGEAYYSPDDPERVLGYQATYVGVAKLLVTADPSTLRVIESNREVLSGDHLLPIIPQAELSEFSPRAPEELMEGYIVGLLDGIERIGQYQVVVLSLGEIDGVVPGHTLSIWRQGKTLIDQRSLDKDEVILPDSLAGVAMVFRVFENTSYALIMNAYKEMYINDKVMNDVF